MSMYAIHYNPYQNITEIKKDGVVLKENCSLCKGIYGKRLQSWFDRDGSWSGLGEELERNNNEASCSIDFWGREIDYLDLKEYFENVYKSGKGTIFSLKLHNASSDKEMYDRLLQFVNEIKAEPNPLFTRKQIKDIEDSVYKIRRDPFVISVLATMSAGKSTLLNALMHCELLPTGDVATTANIVEIYDNDKGLMKYEAYDKDGNLKSNGEGIASDAMFDMVKKINEKEINGDKNIRKLKIYGDIPGVDTKKLQLMLRDTPGPNNSGDEAHKEITNQVINNARDMSTVIYVMNATQPEVEDDEKLLKSIAKEMKEGGLQANDRFLFVVNKVDEWIKKPEQTNEGLLDRVRKYLKDKAGIDNPRIFPVAARLACNIYKCRSGKGFTQEEIEDDIMPVVNKFNRNNDRVNLEQFSSVSPCVRRLLDEDMKRAEELEDENEKKWEKALIHSGIRGLEYSIKEYMEKYAYPIKVAEAVTDITDLIDEKKMRDAFRKKLSEDKNKLNKVKKNIEEIERKKDERRREKERFEKKIEEYKIRDSFRKDALKMVEDIFGTTVDMELNYIPDKLEKSEAEALLGRFTIKVRDNEEELDKKLKEMVNEEVVREGNNLLEEYRNCLQSLKAEMNIEGFEFDRVRNLKRYDLGNLERVVRTVTSQEPIMKEKKEWVKNPERHWYNPWKPKMVERTKSEKIGEREYVNRGAVIDSILEARINARKNVNEIIGQAEELVEEFKVFFKGNLNEFSENIEQVVHELMAYTKQENLIKINQAEHEKQLSILEGYIKKVKNITNCKGA